MRRSARLWATALAGAVPRLGSWPKFGPDSELANFVSAVALSLSARAASTVDYLRVGNIAVYW